VVRFIGALPREPAVDAIVRQLARFGPGVSSNYRSTRRARSRAEFIARPGIVVDEVDETIFSKSLATARKNHQIPKS
jgi:hypothetical protein